MSAKPDTYVALFERPLHSGRIAYRIRAVGSGELQLESRRTWSDLAGAEKAARRHVPAAAEVVVELPEGHL